MQQRKTVLVLILILMLTGLLNANIINIPQDQPTIQMGIDSTGIFDTVLVAPDIYYENIDFKGKNIVVASNYLLTGDFQDILNTVINGSNPVNPDSASTVRFSNGEDSFSILKGFTISGGTGTKWIDPQYPSYTWRGGGGIFMFNSNPLIEHNFIGYNSVTNVSGVNGAQGGGMFTYGGNPIIRNNFIAYNDALYGAGMVIDYSGCVLKNNIIYENFGGQSYGGGGIWILGNGSDSIIIENNSIISNHSLGSGAYGGRGGAIFIWVGNIYLRNNIIWENTQTNGGPIAEVEGGHAFASYNDIEGGFTGIGNIDLDPCFSDSFFILSDTSPCIDSGNPASEFNDPEDSLNPGFAIFPAKGSLRNDMGVYGGPWSELINYFVSGVEEWTVHEIPVQTRFMTVTLNHGICNIQYQLSSRSQVNIKIYSINGSCIRDLLVEIQNPGSYSLTYDLRMFSKGIYFLNLTTDYFSDNEKLMLLE